MAETGPSRSLESELHEVKSKTEQHHQVHEKAMNHQEAAAEDGCSIENGKMSGQSSTPLPSVVGELQLDGHSSQICQPSFKIDSVGSECARDSLVDPMAVLSNCDKSLGASEDVNPSQVTKEKSPETCLQDGVVDDMRQLSEDMNGGSNHGERVVEPLCDSVGVSMSSGALKENGMNEHVHLTSDAVNPHEMVAEYDASDQVKGYSSQDKLETVASIELDKDDVNHNSIQLNNSNADGVSDQIMKGLCNELPPSGQGVLGNEYEVINCSGTVYEGDPTLQPQPSVQDVAKASILDQAGIHEGKMLKDSDTHNQVESVEQSGDSYRSSQPCAEIHATPSNKSGAKVESSVSNQRTNSQSSRRGHKTTPKTLVKSEYTLRSVSGSTGTQKSNSKDKDALPEKGTNAENVASKRRRRSKSKIEKKSHDEFEKMRKQLKYWLHRITLEQNLIDAYSSEGWRGQSLEKLKPEMEIQRAKKDINRSKLSIRGLFQRIVALSGEGRFPDSLFDSDGLLDSEDIYCAKCGSKEVASNNDIILCDGPCDRGFHQFCLDPPLRTEDIPPGDEGWLCPACDCKIDCIGVLNDSMGLKLSIDDSWEKVFPEAEKMTGSVEGNDLGLPSDDSDDNDYDPDGVNDDKDDDDDDDAVDNDDADNSEGSKSSSDESNFSSASEDLTAFRNGDQYAGLPSDDSEDEDFDPNNTDSDSQVKQGSSSSEFTSASENLVAVGGDGDDDDNDENCTVEGPPELSPEGDDIIPVSGKRKKQRLDYKKLYDETYANTGSSSDDEEWKDALEPKKNNSEEEYSDPSNTIGRGKRTRKSGKEKNVTTPKRRKYASRRRAALDSKGEVPTDVGVSGSLAKSRNNTPQKSHKLGGLIEELTPASKNSPVSGHGGGGKRGAPYKKLGVEVTQKLHSIFKENQYPERSTKEQLAAEVGLTFQQVDKWFGNARWSLHHSSAKEAAISEPLPKRKGGRPPKLGTKSPDHSRQEAATSEPPPKRKGGRPRKMGTESPDHQPRKKGTKSPSHKEGRVSTRTPTKVSNVAQQKSGTRYRNRKLEVFFNKLEVGESSRPETLSPRSEREYISLERPEVVQALTSKGADVLPVPNGSVKRNRRRSRA